MADQDGEIEIDIEIGEDAAWVAAALVLVAVLGGAVVLSEWPLWGVDVQQSDAPGEPNLVEPAENGTVLWPYTSKRTTYGSKTLGINMVFFGDPADVRTALTRRSELEWEEEQLHEGDAESQTISYERVTLNPNASNLTDVVAWDSAEGSTRYTYVEVGDQGRWIDESYQLHAGTYFGSRQHIRAYDDPRGEWTAVQIHGEYWDWFRLRHTVMGVSDAQRQLEREFMGERYVDRVVRMPFENGRSDSDGWATGIHLVGTVLPLVLVGITIRTRRAQREVRRFLDRRSRELTLGAGLFALFTTIRHLGIAGEQLFPGLNPKIIAAFLYFVLVVGTPSIAYVLGRGSDRSWAFAFAALGLGAAFVVDYAVMGVSVVPLRVALHRGAVLLAVGLVALGGAATAESESIAPPLYVGLAGWALALLAPLFGYL
ncbi:hypothetical protein HWV07_04545 [Natronomonas salina]|uniref:hypothetical protein n=1 Tax=Natronomonas salina TaxID=1710540 RepID=UPI0015B769DB|nr:hypothetical protein [Natronomonas salina]QLD88338.1 hypothetical protein HWV07_04545 [Natronomonas salina]